MSYHPPLRRSVLAIALGLALLQMSSTSVAAGEQATEIRRQYHVPAGNLADAITEFGRQSHLMISFGSEVAAGRRSNGLNGEYTARQGLQILLDNSNLEAVQNADGAYVLRVRMKPSAEAAAKERGAFGLPTVYVSDENALEPGRQIISARAIADTPTANHSLTEIVAMNPAVRLNSKAGGSLMRGSMDVEDISFHGASPYQNLFQIDGMDGTNNIDPANHNTSLQIGNISSNSQAYFVDTSLLGEVRVYDSNVPVEYGRFNGGVVDATLKRATGKNSFDFSYRKSGSNLSEQKVSKYDESNYALGKSEYTPKWEKNFYSMNMDRMLTRDLGLVLGVSRRDSSIQRASYVNGTTSMDGIETHHDTVDNVMAKLTWWKNAGTTSDLTLKYSQRASERNDSFYRNTRWTTNHDAIGVAWNLDHRLSNANLNVKVGWDRFSDSRDSDSNAFITHFYVAAGGMPAYTISGGGYAKEEKQKDAWTVSSKLSFDTFSTGPLQHSAYIGMDAQKADVHFQRYDTAYSYQLRHFADGTLQERSKTQYLPGIVDLSYNSLGLYAADKINWGRVSLTPGVRMDRDNFLNNVNVAPRVRADWDVLGNQQTILTAGVARYYGTNILNLALLERISRMRKSLLDSSGNPSTVVTAPAITNYRDLRTPYNDELSLAWTQEFSGMRSVLSYVHRDGKDQINKRVLAGSVSQYTNAGASTADTYGLSITNAQPWKFAEGNWRSLLIFSRSKYKSNNNLVNGYDDSTSSGLIYYNGVLMDASERPPSNFNQPSSVRMQLNGAWDQYGLRWNNQINWRSSRQDVFQLSNKNGLPNYVDGTIAAYWTWDASFMYRPTFYKNLEFQVDVLNVLNKTPALTATIPTSTTDRNLYATGREIWLQMTYRF